MGKSSPSTPAAPDPIATAAAQTATNKETAITQAELNNANQVTPYGNLTYTQNGTYDDGTPKFTSTTTLSPEEQQLYNLNTSGQVGTAQLGNDQLGRIAGAVSTPYSYAGLPDAPTDQTMAQSQAAGTQAIMDRLAPQEARDRNSQNVTLSNQGVQPGSEAYNNAQDQLARTQNDANQQAILSGQQYATAGQQQALANRQQAITEYSTQRNAPLNEYSALVSGSQVQNPSFQSTGNTAIAPTDLSGDVYKSYAANVAQANAKTASQNATKSAIFGLGGQLGAAAISDIRLKSNIKAIGKLRNGVKVYTYTYMGDDAPQVGVMAQEVLHIPNAVVIVSGGYYAVDYGKVLNHGL